MPSARIQAWILTQNLVTLGVYTRTQGFERLPPGKNFFTVKQKDGRPAVIDAIRTTTTKLLYRKSLGLPV